MREVIMRLTPKPFEQAEYAEIVQELVRCKDCRWWDTDGYGIEFGNEGDGWCDHIERDTHGDWFCADGERKDDERG